MTPEQAKQAVAEIEKAAERARTGATLTNAAYSAELLGSIEGVNDALVANVGYRVAALPPGFLADCVEVAMAAHDEAAPTCRFERNVPESIRAALARVRAHLETKG